jgi:hypothetical protein
MKIINDSKYPWLAVSTDYQGDSSFSSSSDATRAIDAAKEQLKSTGAVSFPNFFTANAAQHAVNDMRRCEDLAYTTDECHTTYLKDIDWNKFPKNSVYNHEMKTKVASTAFDELPSDSVLKKLYHDPRLLHLVSKIVDKQLYLSEDPLGCCSVNVFRPNYHHSFHFDEAEFSVTLMLQPAEDPTSGLFQYTNPLRQTSDDLALEKTANALHLFDPEGLEGKMLYESTASATSSTNDNDNDEDMPVLYTLDFQPGTLLIIAGSKSLHRVTQIRGTKSRLVAVLTFSSRPGFCNSAAVQKMFWGRSRQPDCPRE